MDIIITGEQGAGKTTAAEVIIKQFRPPYGQRYSDADVLYIHDAYWTPATLLTEMLRAARVRAVVFDGCITNPGEMLAAVAAVKKYREQIKTDILAIYVAQGDAVMITDGEIKRPDFSDNRFRDCPPSQQMEEGGTLRSSAPSYGRDFDRDFMVRAEKRSDAILADTWNLAAERVDEAGSDLMVRELTRLASAAGIGQAGETAGLHHLDADGKIELHKFLLDLLRKYE